MTRIPIFYYHSIGGEPPQTLSLGLFRSHLECLRRHGKRVVPVRELLRDPGPDSVALAFDDGLLDNYINAFPLLQEFGFRATFYVVPGYDRVTRWVNPRNGRWSDRPAPGYTAPHPNMEARHRRELARHGCEIGSHTLTHRNLTGLEPDDLRREVHDSKRWLEDELGQPVTTFCYPRGRFNLSVLRQVRQAGYLGACC
ncbi:MAG: polysaccharide deacetylase family protein, partial [Candidatus Eremiobacterota bacterium]